MKDVSVIKLKDEGEYYIDGNYTEDLNIVKGKILLKMEVGSHDSYKEKYEMFENLETDESIKLGDVISLLKRFIKAFIDNNYSQHNSFDGVICVLDAFKCYKINKILSNKYIATNLWDKEYIGGNCYGNVNLLINIDIDPEEIKRSIFDSLFEEYPFNGIEKMQMLYDKFNNLYPGNAFIDRKFGVVGVYYPEIIIKNSLKLEHKITDLYIVFKRGFHFQTFRTSGTFEELYLSYSHSHCSNGLGVIGNMCLGYGALQDKIVCLTSEFSSDNVDEEEIEGLVYLFDNYIKWESLEGKPYGYISTIINFYKDNFRNYSQSIPFDKKKFTYDILNQIKFFPDSLGYIKILNTNEELQEIFKPLIPSNFSNGEINISSLENAVTSKNKTRLNINQKYRELFNISKEKETVDINIDGVSRVLKKEIKNKDNDILFPLSETIKFKETLTNIINEERTKKQYFS